MKNFKSIFAVLFQGFELAHKKRLKNSAATFSILTVIVTAVNMTMPSLSLDADKIEAISSCAYESFMSVKDMGILTLVNSALHGYIHVATSKTAGLPDVFKLNKAAK